MKEVRLIYIFKCKKVLLGLVGGMRSTKCHSSPHCVYHRLLLPSQSAHKPVHARKVTPEVASAVGSRHFLGIDHHRVALKSK